MRNKKNALWIIFSLALFVIVIITIPAVIIVNHQNKVRNEKDIARNGLTKIIEGSGISKADIFCEDSFGASIIGEGAATRHTVYILMARDTSPSGLLNSVLNNGFKGYTQEFVPGRGAVFTKIAEGTQSYKETISTSYKKTGTKPYANCGQKLDYSYVVPTDKNMLVISYVVSSK